MQSTPDTVAAAFRIPLCMNAFGFLFLMIGLIMLRARAAEMRLREEIAPPLHQFVVRTRSLPMSGIVSGGWEFVIAAYTITITLVVALRGRDHQPLPQGRSARRSRGPRPRGQHSDPKPLRRSPPLVSVRRARRRRRGFLVDRRRRHRREPRLLLGPDRDPCRPGDKAVGATIRLGGHGRRGSIVAGSGASDLEFDVTDGTQTVHVQRLQRSAADVPRGHRRGRRGDDDDRRVLLGADR